MKYARSASLYLKASCEVCNKAVKTTQDAFRTGKLRCSVCMNNLIIQ